LKLLKIGGPFGVLKIGGRAMGCSPVSTTLVNPATEVSWSLIITMFLEHVTVVAVVIY